jgi:hypothetical protein
VAVTVAVDVGRGVLVCCAVGKLVADVTDIGGPEVAGGSTVGVAGTDVCVGVEDRAGVLSGVMID